MRFLLFVKWVFRVWKTFWAIRKNFDINFGIVKGASDYNFRKFSFGMVVAIVSRDYVESVTEPESQAVRDRLDKFSNTLFDVFYKQSGDADVCSNS